MKNTKFMVLIFATITVKTQMAHSFEPCKNKENAIFICNVGEKMASLCQRKYAKQLQYKFGQKSKYEFIYPSSLTGSIEKFKLSTSPAPGGGENRIRFTNGIYSYFIYDITKSQQDTAPLNSIQTAGIAVYTNGKRIANIKCENSETSISSLAFEILQREEFSYDIDTD